MKEKTLYPYQVEGAKFLADSAHALLADEPGLGKTVQAIRAAWALGFKRILVVCPASVRLNWWQEVEEMGGCINPWRVISYNGAVRGLGIEGTYDLLILDEVHFLKTADSQRTQAVFGPSGVARRCKYIWGLSGTPVLNRPVELWPMLKTMHPSFAGMSYTAYTQRFCGAYFDGFGINVKGASHLEELKQKIGSFMLRRTKKEVLPQLPPKIISRIPLDVSKQDLTALFQEELKIGNREAKLSSIAEDFSALGDLAHLLRMTGEAKVPATTKFVAELLETVEKVVVFVRHRSVVDALEAAMRARGYNPVVFHGGMSDTQKKAAVEIFNGKGCRVFIGNIQAAGTGINGLQDRCSTVVFGELSWVPGEMGQAVDRCHRIGQSAESVNVYVLHIPGTLESAVLQTLESKTLVIDRLMGDA